MSQERSEHAPERMRAAKRRAWMAPGALCFALVLFLGASCGNGETTARDSEEESEAPVKRNVKPEPDAEVAVIETDYGRPIVIELYSNIAPRMVERFKKLIGEGFYDGTTFHRINPELGIIQGGDPLSRDNDPNNDGTGNSDDPNLPAEFTDIPYERGTVGAARSSGVNTANSQFFITLKRQPEFDQRYTVFGRVMTPEGLNTAEVIMSAPTADGSEQRPSERIVVKRVTLQPRANFGSGG